MALIVITPADFDGGTTQADIDGALGRAALFAPCLSGDGLTDSLAAAARDIIVQALKRREQNGSGAVVTESTPHFSQTVDNRQQFKDLFWKSERDELRAICAAVSAVTASAVLPTGAFPDAEVYPDAVPVW